MNAKEFVKSGLPLAALFVAACGPAPDHPGMEGDLPVQPAATLLPPPQLPPPSPIPITSPKINTAPQNATVGTGAGARFSVSVGGLAPFTYRWYRNGVAIAGAAGAGSSYTVAAATAADAGTYAVLVTDAFGFKASASASLQVVTGWAALSGRGIVTTSGTQQPSLTLCGQPHAAFLSVSPASGRKELFVRAFDGASWAQKGTLLNATADGSAADPSLACVRDAAASWPVVAWSEGNELARDIHVRYWNGNQWQAAGAPLNIVPGSLAVRPVLYVPPYDAGAGNVPVSGITRRAAIAWIENGQPSVRRWYGDWQALFNGSQIPGASGATDIALKIDLEYQGRYPVVVAWLQAEGGGRRPYAAMHVSSTTADGTERGGWTQLGIPSAFGNPLPASPAARIGVATGKLGASAAPAPVVLWAEAASPNMVRSYFYPSTSYLQPVANQPWSAFGSFAPVAAPKAVALDPDELAREFCPSSGLTIPVFGVAVSDATGFEVRRSNCASTTVPPARWIETRPRFAMALEETSLRMAGPEDPIVAGTRLVGSGQYELSVWRYYP